MENLKKKIIRNHVEKIMEVFPFTIKEKQFDDVANIVRGKDTLCVLPTSFGKSLIYQMLPVLAKNLGLAPSPLVIVVSPLIALIKDQIHEANSSPLGLKACAVQEDMKGFSMIFGTPDETWLKNSTAQKFHKSAFTKFPASKTEAAFHESIARISELRSICRSNLPVLATSATVNADLTELIMNSVELSKNVKVIAALPLNAE
ncbi:probable ATP-dependent DNA helicase RecS [Clytia hemisphaerica]|uniref:probable ATP-dependent DNA helicase RecS n=1 Tax=Clytia hemisphaerica TaxID=252671 RepID=UPI0034D3D422